MTEKDPFRKLENRSPKRMIESRQTGLELARELARDNPDDPAFQNLLKTMEEVAAEEGIRPKPLSSEEE